MTRLELIKRKLARQSFIEMDAVFDRDALPLGVEQSLDGQPPAPFAECDHDPVRAGNRAKSTVERADERNTVFEHAPRFTRLHQVQDPVSPSLSQLRCNSIGQVALTEHEDIFDKRSDAHG
jgi:hypothetical protein